LAQTSSAWKLTVVDDAYPGTELANYLTDLDHPRVRYVRKDQNGGITENFRTCVQLAELPLTVVLGCDDRLLPNYVERILKAHSEFPQVTIIQPGVQVIDESGLAIRPLVDRVKTDLVKPRGGGYQLLGGEPLAANLLTGDWLYWPSLAFRTERLKQFAFRNEFPVTQDLALVMDMVFDGDQVLTFDTVCFEYRRHSRSASSVELLDAGRFASERQYFALAAQIASTKGWRRAVRAARGRLTSRAHAITVLPRTLLRGQFRTALDLLRHALGS
jgi:hypothetical protein